MILRHFESIQKDISCSSDALSAHFRSPWIMWNIHWSVFSSRTFSLIKVFITRWETVNCKKKHSSKTPGKHWEACVQDVYSLLNTEKKEEHVTLQWFKTTLNLIYFSQIQLKYYLIWFQNVFCFCCKMHLFIFITLKRWLCCL